MKFENVKDLYVLGIYKDGSFVDYERKTRNYSIVGYDNLSAAKRGLAHSKRDKKNDGYEIKIMHAEQLQVLDSFE